LHRNFVPYIAQFPELTYLNLDTLAIAVNSNKVDRAFNDLFRDLSMLEKLVELHLPSDLEQHHLPQCVGFSRLTVLRTGNTPVVIAAFLNMIAPETLHTLHFTGEFHGGDHNDWKMCFDKLRERCGSSLCSLQFRSTTATTATNFPVLEIVSPLFKIRGLEDVALEVFSEPLSSEIMEAMALAWPNLTSLKFGKETICPFEGLAHLFHFCPKIVALDVHVEVEGSSDMSSITPLSHTLQSLSLYISRDMDYIHLARFVDRLFPNIQTVTMKTAVLTAETAQALLAIPRVIKAFQAIRAECRFGISG
jgi:hypothetical protein